MNDNLTRVIIDTNIALRIIIDNNLVPLGFKSNNGQFGIQIQENGCFYCGKRIWSQICTFLDKFLATPQNL